MASTQQPVIQVGLMDPVLGAVETPALVDQAFGPAIKANPALDLYGSGHTTDLGDALPNNVAPSPVGRRTRTGAERGAGKWGGRSGRPTES